MTTIQLGAALSEPLLDRVGPGGTVALRLALAALILWPFVRPPLLGRTRADLGAAVALGACSGLLTLAFFEAIARIPLGVAVTIEFLGPLGVALAGSRHARDVAWVVVAGAGVALLTLGDGAGEPLDATGVALAGVAAAGWELIAPGVLLAGVGLALLIPLLPFAFELVALRRLPTALFGVIMSLEPAIAALLGFLILDQGLAVAGVAAIAMVVVASAGATLSSRAPPLDE